MSKETTPTLDPKDMQEFSLESLPNEEGGAFNADTITKFIEEKFGKNSAETYNAIMASRTARANVDAFKQAGSLVAGELGLDGMAIALHAAAMQHEATAKYADLGHNPLVQALIANLILVTTPEGSKRERGAQALVNAAAYRTAKMPLGKWLNPKYLQDSVLGLEKLADIVEDAEAGSLDASEIREKYRTVFKDLPGDK